MNKRKTMVAALLLSCGAAMAQTWIWYPGDMDIWMGNRIGNLRTEDGGMRPQFWRTDGHWQTVDFSKTVELAEEEEVEIAVEGQYSVRIDKRYLFGMPHKVTVPKGRHTIGITVTNLLSPPAIWLRGRTLKSDSTWYVSDYVDNVPCDTWHDIDGSPLFDTADRRPSLYRLPVTPIAPIRTEREGNRLFVDFGREAMGYLRLDGIKGKGLVRVSYGESADEARDKERSYLRDRVLLTGDSAVSLRCMSATLRRGDTYQFPESRAMRYALIECDGGVSIDGVTLMSEMKDLGESYRGSFECSDTLINRIWQVGAYTLHLTDREVMIEGIKRDRWMWSGDAIQSYLMNYYVFMDAPVVKRTIWALRGKDPVRQHINTILDYTFYWFNSIYDYYLYTGDSDFVRRIYPRMLSLMRFVEGRLNGRGLVEGKKGDWVFVDWPPRKMPKSGELSFQQMVYLRSLQAMSLCADVVGDKVASRRYSDNAQRIQSQLVPLFWDNSRKAFVHNIEHGRRSDAVTRYSNMFAVIYGLVNHDCAQDILHNVLLNDSVMPITTPYMRFYELEALCALGEHRRVLEEMRNYWGGMLREGATTFWETYDPQEKYPQRLAMYGHRYGKSLCHAWGASPIYLLGKHFLGVRPVRPGYSDWEAAPCLGGLTWMRGDVPTPDGNIHIEMTARAITVRAQGCGPGTLLFQSSKRPKPSRGVAEPLGEGKYRLRIEPGSTVTVRVG